MLTHDSNSSMYSTNPTKSSVRKYELPAETFIKGSNVLILVQSAGNDLSWLSES